MARYFFDLVDGKTEADEVGTELASDDLARREAARLFGGMLKDAPDDFLADEQRTVRVRTADGLTLFTVSLLTTRAPAAAVARVEAR